MSNTSNYYNLLTERSRLKHPELTNFSTQNIERTSLGQSFGDKARFRSLENSDIFASEISRIHDVYLERIRAKNEISEKIDIKDLSQSGMKFVKDSRGNVMIVKAISRINNNMNSKSKVAASRNMNNSVNDQTPM